MSPGRLDCRKAEAVTAREAYVSYVCRWCGRPVFFDRGGKPRHRRGHQRVHPDPRDRQA